MALKLSFLLIWQLIYNLFGAILTAFVLWINDVNGWFWWAVFLWVTYSVGQMLTAFVFGEPFDEDSETVSNT